MDKLEMNILDILTEDARTPISQIAVMLGATEAQIADTVARLERQRVILKYPALINWEKVDVEQVEAMMRREPSDRTGIGIKNVNDRLRIYFGEQYGLTIHSVPDEGTTVIIRMPKIKEGEYEETR